MKRQKNSIPGIAENRVEDSMNPVPKGNLARCSVFDKNHNTLILNESVENGGIYELIRDGDYFLEPSENDVISECEAILKNICTSQLYPAWSEWSECSATCWGITKRENRCKNGIEQVKSCNENISCPRSSKFKMFQSTKKELLKINAFCKFVTLFKF